MQLTKGLKCDTIDFGTSYLCYTDFSNQTNGICATVKKKLKCLRLSKRTTVRVLKSIHTFEFCGEVKEPYWQYVGTPMSLYIFIPDVHQERNRFLGTSFHWNSVFIRVGQSSNDRIFHLRAPLNYDGWRPAGQLFAQKFPKKWKVFAIAKPFYCVYHDAYFDTLYLIVMKDLKFCPNISLLELISFCHPCKHQSTSLRSTELSELSKLCNFVMVEILGRFPICQSTWTCRDSCEISHLWPYAFLEFFVDLINWSLQHAKRCIARLVLGMVVFSQIPPESRQNIWMPKCKQKVSFLTL